MSWPAALLWVLIFAAAVSNGPGLLYLLMVCGVCREPNAPQTISR
jgi:hypothetical protein